MNKKRFKICCKLIAKKSNTHLRISIAMFLLSVVLINVIATVYAKQYIQYKKDFFDNISLKTIYVDAIYKDGRVEDVSFNDVNEIEQILSKNYNDKNMKVIPVYTCMGVFIDGEAANVFGIEKSNSFFVGLDEMDDDTGYVVGGNSGGMVSLEVSVIDTNENGYESKELKQVVLEKGREVNTNTPFFLNQNQYLTPSTKSLPIVFVNEETFEKIASVAISKKYSINSPRCAVDSGVITLAGIYVYEDDLALVSDISEKLTRNGYRAYATTDVFENFGNTLSITVITISLAAAVLLLLTTVNILLSFKSFYRVQQKDMGILKYMGFSAKQVYKMYCVNLAKSFSMIAATCTAFVLAISVVLLQNKTFSFAFVLILVMILFMIIIFAVISNFVIKKQSKKDIVVLIRESKEFE